MKRIFLTILIFCSLISKGQLVSIVDSSGYLTFVNPLTGAKTYKTTFHTNAAGTLAILGANTFTGTQALGANNLTMTGSIAATGARVTKGWFTDGEFTNMPTVGGTALNTTFQAALVSGTNIKTVNSTSLLGSGDIAITGMTNPMTTGGDLIYGGASGTPTRLANGTANYVLQSNGTTLAPTWVPLAGGGNALTGNPLSQFASTTSAQLNSVISDESGTGNMLTTNGDGSALTGLTATQVSLGNVTNESKATMFTSPAFTGLATSNNIQPGFQAIPTAAGTTTLSVSSPYRTAFTGTNTQTVKLPAANTLSLGTEYYIDNNSTLAVTVQDNGANTLYTIAALHDAFFVVTDISSVNGVWDLNGPALLEAANTFASTQTFTTATATTITATAGAGFQNMVVQTSGSAASWSLPAALQVTGAKFKVTIIGGGGQGGGTSTTAGQTGGGGGSGGVVVYYVTYVAGQNTMTYTVGAGGSTSTGSTTGQTGTASSIIYNSVTITASGGVGGLSGATNGAGGAGGAASGGTLNIAGFNGSSSGTMASTSNFQGDGGNTPLGFGEGGRMPSTAAGANGNPGLGYGAGGSGGRNGTGTTARNGGAGVIGVVIIEY